MPLIIQIYSFVFSFLFGIFFEILLSINSKFIYSSNLFVKIISSIIFILFNKLLYFFIIFRINYGVLHIYFLLSILLGYIFMCKVKNKILNLF